MSKHTPGPWITEEADSNSIDIVRNFEIIAEVINHNCDYLTYKDIANAKLIAAAPDLLETLERLLLTSCAAVDPSKDNIYMKKFYEARDKAFEAIKKATL